MNRRAFSILAIIALVVFAFTSCSTSVALNTLVPAQANVSGYKTIAIRTATNDSNWKLPAFRDSLLQFKGSVDQKYIKEFKVVSGLESGTMSKILESATEDVYHAMDTGVYKLVAPETTDALITIGKTMGTTVRKTLNEKGIDAILSTSISGMSYEEYLLCETDTYKSKDSTTGAEYFRKRFYVVQKYSVAVTYTLTDVENNAVIAYDTISQAKENKVQIGYTKNAAGDLEKFSYSSAEKAATLIKRLVSDICYEIKLALAPHYKTEYFSLMSNKPKIDSLKVAYKFVDNGDYRLALELFVNQYRTSGHVASGYNACILYYALGEYDNAFELASELYYRNGSTKAIELYRKMRDVKERQDAAIAQINSTEKSAVSQSQELIGF